jgi:hypothetical protein
VNNDCDGAGGSIEITIPESLHTAAPYTFFWSELNGGGTSLPSSMVTTDEATGYSLASGLSAGTYCVIIVTGNACAAQSCEFTIEEFEAPEITPEITPVSSSGASDGIIKLAVTGGDGPYTYNWSNGTTSYLASGLSVGDYWVEVGYGDGGVEKLDFVLLLCSDLGTEISLEAIMTPMSSQNPAAMIDLTVVGGENYNFHYLWTWDGQSITDTEDISTSKPGEYCVIVSWAECNNMSIELCVTICNFEFEIKYGNYYCGAVEAMAIASNGASPFTYLWNDNTTNPLNTVQYGIEHCVTVTDNTPNTPCEMEICFTPEMPAIETAINVTNAFFGASNGQIALQVSGGIAPYTYQWDNGATTNVISNLAAGEYCVLIKDNCGNSITRCIVVECEILEEQVIANITDVACSGTFGAIDITVLETQPGDNTFIWSNGETSEDISGLGAGEYSVTIVNNSTICTIFKSYTVEVQKIT